MGNPDFPSDVISEILSRLPVKSLCRFRCVSKSWLSFIADPDFVKRHLNKATESEDIFNQRRRLIFTDESNGSVFSLDLDEFLNRNDAIDNYLDKDYDNLIINIDDNDDVAATELDCVITERPDDVACSVFHSNGLLLCQSYYMDLYLVNPATRESKELPHIPDVGKAYYFNLLGFGFDHSSGDYKVVILSYLKGGIMFSVYTLKTGSWRIIQTRYPYKCVLMRHGILLNGGLHWLLDRVGVEHRSSVIISFDLAEENVQEIALPLASMDGKDYIVGAYRDSLCVTHYADGVTHNEFWIMKEYGVRESWTKVRISIPYSVLRHSGFWKKSRDLLVFRDRLVLCNSNGERFRNLSISGLPKVNEVGIYLESLVSPYN